MERITGTIAELKQHADPRVRARAEYLADVGSDYGSPVAVFISAPARSTASPASTPALPVAGPLPPVPAARPAPTPAPPPAPAKTMSLEQAQAIVARNAVAISASWAIAYGRTSGVGASVPASAAPSAEELAEARQVLAQAASTEEALRRSREISRERLGAESWAEAHRRAAAGH
jgi:hypothetical protein